MKWNNTCLLKDCLYLLYQVQRFFYNKVVTYPFETWLERLNVCLVSTRFILFDYDFTPRNFNFYKGTSNNPYIPMSIDSCNWYGTQVKSNSSLHLPRSSYLFSEVIRLKKLWSKNKRIVLYKKRPRLSRFIKGGKRGCPRRGVILRSRTERPQFLFPYKGPSPPQLTSGRWGREDIVGDWGVEERLSRVKDKL